jgi:hypothetical protein
MFVYKTIKDVLLAVEDGLLTVTEARVLIEKIDPEFYTKPNKLKGALYVKMVFNCIQILALVAFMVWVINI